MTDRPDHPDPILRTLRRLDRNQLAALEIVCQGFGRSPEEWRSIKAIELIFSTLAVRSLEKDLRESGEETTKAGARATACIRLGEKIETVSSRLKSWGV